MLTLDATQQALVAATTKEATWAIYIYDSNGVGYAYSTGTIGVIAWDTSIVWDTGIAWDDGDSLQTVVLMDFNGIDLARNRAEETIIAPSSVTFTLSNPLTAMTCSDFPGGSVLVELYLSNATYGERQIAAWKFNIKSCEPGYQILRFTCEDFLQKYLRGDYPNLACPEDIFPSNASYAANHDGLCVPVPFGTAYVPLRPVYLENPHYNIGTTISFGWAADGSQCWIYDTANGFLSFRPETPINVSGATNPENNGKFTPTGWQTYGSILYFDKDTGFVTEAAGATVVVWQGDVYFVLGPDDYSYTINRMRSPRSIGDKSVWISPTTTFTKSDHTDSYGDTWTMFQPIIQDTDHDGVNDAPGLWRPGDNLLDAPVRFSRSDTASMTSPADVIDFVLKDMGIPAADIDATTFAAAKATYASWDLEFNGAFWYKQSREKVLAQLLTMCHSCLRVGSKIELHVLSKTSQKTITAAEVTRSGDYGEGSFRYTDLISQYYSNCGYIAWQKDYEAQDSFLKLLVPAKTSRTVISGDILEVPFIQDSQNAQRVGTLHYQRKLLKTAEIAFDAKSTCLALQPDDVITVNHAHYGGNYAAIVDRVRIAKDLTITFSGSAYSVALDDWTDLSPTAVTIPSDDTAYAWTPTISGPQTDQDIGRSAYDLWGKEWLKVGPQGSAGQYTDIQKALNAVKQAGGGAIYILNGTYQLTAPLYVPDVNLEVMGQSQGGVILKNAAGSDLWIFHSLTKTFVLRRFSIASQNSGTVSNMLYIYGTSSYELTAKLTLDAIKMTLVDNGLGSTSDKGIYHNRGGEGSRITLINSDISGSRTAVRIADLDFTGTEQGNSKVNAILSENEFDLSNINICCKYFDVNTNKIVNGYVYGSSLNANGNGNIISGNKIYQNDDGLIDTNVYGIYAAADQMQVLGNFISIDISTVALTSPAAILGSHDNMTLSNNRIEIIGAFQYGTYGISLAYADNNTLVGNPIKINNTDHTTYTYGIHLSSSLRNVINGHNINLVNNDAKEIGVYLSSGSNNNQGSDNITYNCGTSISDAGTGNAVTAKDV